MRIQLSAIQGSLTFYRENMKAHVFPKLSDLSLYSSCFLLHVVLFFAEQAPTSPISWRRLRIVHSLDEI